MSDLVFSQRGSYLQRVFKIFDGSTEDSDLLGKFCGTAEVPVIRSSGTALLVRFVSDSSLTWRGFVATYSQRTGKDTTSGR